MAFVRTAADAKAVILPERRRLHIGRVNKSTIKIVDNTTQKPVQCFVDVVVGYQVVESGFSDMFGVF